MATITVEAITARIDQLEALAHAAVDAVGESPWRADTGLEPWAIETADDARHTVAENASEETAFHIAAWDPATVLRGLAEDRDILRRHVPSEFVTLWEHGARYPQCTHGFADEEDELPVDAVRWDRCPEVLSVARRHGVPVPGSDS